MVGHTQKDFESVVGMGHVTGQKDGRQVHVRLTHFDSRPALTHPD